MLITGLAVSACGGTPPPDVSPTDTGPTPPTAAIPPTAPAPRTWPAHATSPPLPSATLLPPSNTPYPPTIARPPSPIQEPLGTGVWGGDDGVGMTWRYINRPNGAQATFYWGANPNGP